MKANVTPEAYYIINEFQHNPEFAQMYLRAVHSAYRLLMMFRDDVPDVDVEKLLHVVTVLMHTEELISDLSVNPGGQESEEDEDECNFFKND